MTCYIYRALNIVNGKSYIGFTKRCLEKRICHHLRDALNGSTCAFHKALRKYGADAFQWSILHESDDEDHCLNIMEPIFILEYRSFGRHGYNMTAGGNRGPRMIGSDNPMYGRSHNDEVRKTLSTLASKRFKEKTYEDLYGKEKAESLRQKRRVEMQERLRVTPPLGAANSNYDKTTYRFSHNDGRIFEGTIFELRQTDPSLTKENTHRLKNGGVSKGWICTGIVSPSYYR